MFGWLRVALLLTLLLAFPPVPWTAEAAVETAVVWGRARASADTAVEDGWAEAWLGTSSADPTPLAPREFSSGDTLYVWLSWLPVGTNTQDHLHIVSISLRNDETDTTIRNLCVTCGESGTSFADGQNIFYTTYTLNEIGTYRLFLEASAHNAAHVQVWRANTDGTAADNNDADSSAGFLRVNPRITNFGTYKSDYATPDDRLVRGQTLYVRFNVDKNIGPIGRLISEAGAHTGFRQEVNVVVRTEGGNLLFRATFALVDTTSSAYWSSFPAWGTLTLSKPSNTEYRVAWSPGLGAPTGPAQVVIETLRFSGLVEQPWIQPNSLAAEFDLSSTLHVAASASLPYANRGETLTVSGTVTDPWGEALASTTLNVDVVCGASHHDVASPTTNATGGFSASWSVASSAEDTYTSTSPGVEEARDCILEIHYPATSTLPSQGSYGTQPGLLDMDSGIWADVHLQRAPPLVKDAPQDEAEDSQFYIAADQVHAWVHARNVRGQDWADLPLELRLFPPGASTPKASVNLTTDATGWTGLALFDPAAPAGTWTLVASSPTTGNDAPSADTANFLSPNTDHLILDPVGWSSRLELGQPATFQLRTLRYERSNASLYAFAPDAPPRIVAHWAAPGSGDWTLLFDTSMGFVSGSTYRFDWNVPSDSAWLDRRLSVKFGASFSGAWKWSPAESAVVQKGGADPMEVVASPTIANPGETMLLVIHEAFLDGSARTGNAAGTQIYVYRPDGSLAVDGTSPVEVAHGAYRYVFPLGASPPTGNWYVVAKTTDPATGAANSAATAFYVEPDVYVLVQSLQADVQARFVALGADVDLLQADTAALLAKWGSTTASQLANDLALLSGRVGASTDASSTPTLFGRLRDLADRSAEHASLEDQIADLQEALVDVRAILNATRSELGAQGQSPSVYARLVALHDQVSTVEADLADARRVLQRGQDPTRALVARWSFEATTADELDGPAGLNRGGAQVGTPGHVGKAVTLDGTDDYIEVPLSPLGLAPASLTLEAWVRPDAVPAGSVRRILQVSEGTSGSSHVSLNYDTTGRVGFEARATGFPSPVGMSSNAAITVSVWTHVAGVVESSGAMRLYVNGVSQTATATLPALSKLDTVSIGAELSGGGTGGSTPEGFLQGSVDEAGLYDRGLTAREVNQRIEYSYSFVALETFLTTFQADTQARLGAVQTDVDQLQVDASGLLAKWGTTSAPAILADVGTLLSRMGQPTDEATASTVFGKVQSLRDVASTRTSNLHATLNTTQTTMDALRTEVGAAGKTRTAYRLAEDVEALLLRVDANLTTAQAAIRADVASLRAELLSRLDDLRADATALRNDTTDLRARWGTLTAAALDAHLATLEGRLGAATDVAVAATLFGRVQALRDLTGARIDNVHADLNVTRTVLDAARVELGAFGKTRTAYRLLEDLEQRTVNVEANVTAARAAIQSDVAALRADLLAQLDDLKTDVAGVRSDTTALLAKWGTVTATDLQSRLATLQSRIGASTDSATTATVFGRLERLRQAGATQAQVSALHASLNATRAVVDAARAEAGAQGQSRTTYQLLQDVEGRLFQVSGELALAQAALEADHDQTRQHLLALWSDYNETAAANLAALLGRVQDLEDRLATDFAQHHAAAEAAWAQARADANRLELRLVGFEDRLNATLAAQHTALLTILDGLDAAIERQLATTHALWAALNATDESDDANHARAYEGVLANMTRLYEDARSDLSARAGEIQQDVADLRGFTAERLDAQEAAIMATLEETGQALHDQNAALAALLAADGNATRDLLRDFRGSTNETWAAWLVLYGNSTDDTSAALRSFIAREHDQTRTNASFVAEAYFRKYGLVVSEYSAYVVGGLGEEILENRERIEEGRRIGLGTLFWQSFLAELLKYSIFGLAGVALVVLVGSRRARAAAKAISPIAALYEARARRRAVQAARQAREDVAPRHEGGGRRVSFVARD